MKKKYIQYFVFSVVAVGLLVLIYSRRVSKSTFDLMVAINQAEVLEICNNRLYTKKQNPQINFDNVSYNDSQYYHHIISKYGNDICKDPYGLEQILVEHYKLYYKNQWKFIL